MTLKEMLAVGMTDIDVDAADMPKGRGAMAPYAEKKHYDIPEAQLLKITKAEQLALNARPVTITPPHPDVAAYVATLVGGSKAALNSFNEFRNDRTPGYMLGRRTREDTVKEAQKRLAEIAPDNVVQALFYRACIAWFSSPNSR